MERRISNNTRRNRKVNINDPRTLNRRELSWMLSDIADRCNNDCRAISGSGSCRIYTQFEFCLDRVAAVVKERPALKDREPFNTVLSGDRGAMAQLSMRNLFEIVLTTQSGMTVEQFRDDVKKWLATAKHPRWNRPYTELVYQPMLEVRRYLRANGYKTYIATGGSEEFVREYAERVYGIPPEQVAGTAQPVKYGTQLNLSQTIEHRSGSYNLKAAHFHRARQAFHELLVVFDNQNRFSERPGG